MSSDSDRAGLSPAPPHLPLVLHAFPSFAFGGAQVRFAAIANHFGPRFRHAVFAMDGDMACRSRLDPALDLSVPTIALRKGDTIGNVRALHAALRRLRPDVLVTSNWGTIEWALANRGGLVRQLHVEDGFGPDERTRQLPRRVWMRRLALFRRTVVVPSTTLQAIATRVWRLDPARVRYVPNGIDLARFGPGPAATWPGEGPIVGTVAALRAEKNVGRLLHAFAAVPSPARLVVVGDGPERAPLEALAQALGIAARVHWAGHIADPAPSLRGFDVFAMSSDTEQMPISLLEAMAAGLPVAATAVGDIAAMLPPEQQSLVVPLDPAPLGAALARLVHAPALRAALGQANRARATAEYDQARMFAAWGALWRGSASLTPT